MLLEGITNTKTAGHQKLERNLKQKNDNCEKVIANDKYAIRLYRRDQTEGHIPIEIFQV